MYDFKKETRTVQNEAERTEKMNVEKLVEQSSQVNKETGEVVETTAIVTEENQEPV